MVFHFLAALSQIKTYIEIKTIQKNFNLNRMLGKKVRLKKSDERVIIVIAHVVTPGQANTEDRLDKLKSCLDSINRSLAAYQSQIVILTKVGYTLHTMLPSYLQDDLMVHYSEKADPMMVEFDAFDVFKAESNQYDHFIFLEDDIVVNDGWFLEKIKTFNQNVSNGDYLLLPHRFEYANGIKYYLDQTTTYDRPDAHYHYAEHLAVDLNYVKYCVYENPHAAFYCLNNKQLQRWVSSGYKWKDKIVAFGPLESAATFSLFENFKFLKPHPSFIGFFEIQHCSNKYIKKAGLINEYA